MHLGQPVTGNRWFFGGRYAQRIFYESESTFERRCLKHGCEEIVIGITQSHGAIIGSIKLNFSYKNFCGERFFHTAIKCAAPPQAELA